MNEVPGTIRNKTEIIWALVAVGARDVPLEVCMRVCAKSEGKTVIQIPSRPRSPAPRKWHTEYDGVPLARLHPGGQTSNSQGSLTPNIPST